MRATTQRRYYPSSCIIKRDKAFRLFDRTTSLARQTGLGGMSDAIQ